MQRARSSTLSHLTAALSLLLWFAGGTARAAGVVAECSESALRAALAGGGTVTFSCSGTITVTNTVIITTPTVIDGTGQQVVLSGGGAVQVINNRSTTELRRLTIANGYHIDGGGVHNTATLNVFDCTFRDNVTTQVPDVPHDGAGALASQGTLRVERCAFIGNRSEATAFYNTVAAVSTGYWHPAGSSPNSASLINCTFSGNTASVGSIVRVGYGGIGQLEHCTFAGNTGVSLYAGSVYGSQPRAVIRGCAFGPNASASADGAGIEDAGYNISADLSARLNHPTTVLGMDPLLGPLADNGGPTLTLLPQAGSPLIDNALFAGTLAQDQRGVGRPQGFARDVGAVEVENATGVDIFRLTANTITLEESAGSLSVIVTRSGIATNSASVRVFTEDGTALAGSDYTALDVVLDFQPGQVSRTATVPVLNDTEVEPVEAFLVRLDPPGGGALLGNAQLGVTLNSEEVGIRFASATRVVVENQGTASLEVVREGDTRNPLSFTAVRRGGTALAGSDYSLSTSAVSFQSGSTNASVTLTLFNNTSHEVDETLILGLNVSAANTRVTSPSNLVVTIQDDDPVVPGTLGFSTNSVRVAEGSGSALLRVTRTGGTNGVVSVVYTTVADSAAEGGDFVATSGTLQFEEYETQKVIEIPLVVDATAEPDESFRVVLSAPGGGASLGTTTVNVQIQDTPRTLLFCDQASIETAVAVGGTIRFACDGTISFDHRIPILQGVLLDANGHNVVLTAATNGFFQVHDGATLDLRGLTLSGGRALGTLGTANNGASGPGLGGGPGRGGVAVVERAVLRASDCLFLDNQAIGGLGGTGVGYGKAQGQGGAVYGSASVLNFLRCRFENNLARGGSMWVEGPGTLWGLAGAGGALHATNSVVNLDFCHLEGNRAEGGAGTKFNYGLASGGAVELGASLLESARTEWIRNTVSVPSGNGARGGALQAGGRSVVDLLQCRFFANQVRGGNGYYPQTRGGHGQGAGICNEGRMALEACTFHENEAVGGASWGAGALQGAGGAVWNSGRVVAQNCTFHRNHARGGGEHDQTPSSEGMNGHGGGLCNQAGWVETLNCTWVENTAEPSHPSMPSAHLGGGIFNTNGTVRLENNVFDGNLPGGSTRGGIQDLGYNLADDAAGFTDPTSLNQTDPLTGPLADLGGPVPTIYLLPGSPARDVAGVAHFPPADANGLARPQGAGCDLGAVEHPAGAVISGVVRGVGFSRAVPVVVQVGSTVSRPLESGVYAAFVPSSGVYRVTLADPNWVFEPNARDVDVSDHIPDMDFTAHRFAHVHLSPPSTSGAILTFAAASNLAVKVFFSPDVHPATWTSLGDFTTDANGVLRVPVATSPATGVFHVSEP